MGVQVEQGGRELGNLFGAHEMRGGERGGGTVAGWEMENAYGVLAAAASLLNKGS